MSNNNDGNKNNDDEQQPTPKTTTTVGKARKRSTSLPNETITTKKPRKKKQKDEISLVSGKGKSVRFREAVDCTLQDTTIMNDKGYINYVGHLTSKPTIPMGPNGLPTVLDNRLKPEMTIPPHENHNMSTLRTTVDLSEIGGHYPDISQLRKTSFFEDDDDSDDYNPTNDKDLLSVKQVVIVKDRNTSSTSVFQSTDDGGGGRGGNDDDSDDITEKSSSSSSKKRTITSSIQQQPTPLTTKVLLSNAIEHPNNHHKSLFTNEVKAFPIEVLTEQGFTSSYTFGLNECLKIMSNEFKVEAESTEKENNEIRRIALEKLQQSKTNSMDEEEKEQQSPLQTRKKRNNINSELNTVKIAVPFGGNIVQIYSCNLRTNKSHLTETYSVYKADYTVRYDKFFVNDPLDNTVGYHESPKKYKMFMSIKERFYDLFIHNSTISDDSTKMTPKFLDEEPLEKHYIDIYRRRPATNQLTCTNGDTCAFKTIYKDEHTTYVGRRFYTPRENEILKKHQKLVDTGKIDPNTPVKGINNHRGLCIDCILREYFVQVQQNIANDETPEKQLNHFTVRCEEGHYNPSLMLPNFANKPTGIVGNVPQYKTHFRVSVTVNKKKMVDNKFLEWTTNYIAETGMDF